jgi:hypothetical protein
MVDGFDADVEGAGGGVGVCGAGERVKFGAAFGWWLAKTWRG